MCTWPGSIQPKPHSSMAVKRREVGWLEKKEKNQTGICAFCKTWYVDSRAEVRLAADVTVPKSLGRLSA